MIEKRAAGILLPLFSLPSPEGRGCLDNNAFKFIDWLKETKQTYWQMLPIGPTYREGNPYSAYSSFGGDPAFISLNRLVEHGFLKTTADLTAYNDLSLNQLRQTKIDFIAKNLVESTEHLNKFNQFLKENSWVYDFAAFSLLSSELGDKWNEWHDDYIIYDQDKNRELVKNHQKTQPIILAQWLFFEQWNELKKYAHKQQVQLIGDIPIYVDHHSLDIWTAQSLFKLDDKGEPLVVSGAPPDQFSVDGQVWNTPIFNWPAHQQDNFLWWKKRLFHISQLFDIVRIDHFRGLQAYWEIPFSPTPDAKKGKWQPALGRELFTELQKTKNLNLIVEDLGDIDQAVRKLRDDFCFPGMKILQFAFDTDQSNEYLPKNIIKNSVVYTGTHDNDTITAWGTGLESTSIIVKNLNKFHKISVNENFNWDMITLAHNSPANTAIIPLADILNLSSLGRINTPGTIKNNWQWNFNWSEITPTITNQLKQLTISTRRSHEMSATL